jgi:hypothetical protein
MDFVLIGLTWLLFTAGVLLFMRGASYKDNVSRDPDYYGKD